jgi:hypothetical protein
VATELHRVPDMDVWVLEYSSVEVCLNPSSATPNPHFVVWQKDPHTGAFVGKWTRYHVITGLELAQASEERPTWDAKERAEWIVHQRYANANL